MPRGYYQRKPKVAVTETVNGEPADSKPTLSQIRHDAVMSRWDSVQQERDMWILPFHKLEVERALRYLEDLRNICAEAGAIINERLNSPGKIKCSGPRCGHDLSGLKPNGMPKWISKKDFKDKNNPEITHSLYFCSPLCDQEFIRSQMGEAPDIRGKENRIQ